MKKFSFWILLALFSSQLSALEYAPWFEHDLMLQVHNRFVYQHIPNVQTKNGTIPWTSNDYMGQRSLAFTLSPDWNFETELRTAESNQRSFGMDEWLIAGRHLILDDIKGDPFALSLGASIGRVSRIALRDISTPHHGKWEFEGHLAIGKEIPCGRFWLYRFWTLGAVGLASRGKPWIRNEIHLEANSCDCFNAEFFVKSWFGFGGQALDFPPTPVSSFQGFGLIRHRSIDIGTKVTKRLSWGDVSLEYAYRPIARNFPTKVHRATLEISLYFNPGDLPFSTSIARLIPNPIGSCN